MKVLWLKGPMKEDELAKEVDMSLANLSKYLKRLEKGHYITIRSLFFTDDGKYHKVVGPKHGYGNVESDLESAWIDWANVED